MRSVNDMIFRAHKLTCLSVGEDCSRPMTFPWIELGPPSHDVCNFIILTMGQFDDLPQRSTVYLFKLMPCIRCAHCVDLFHNPILHTFNFVECSTDSGAIIVQCVAEYLIKSLTSRAKKFNHTPSLRMFMIGVSHFPTLCPHKHDIKSHIQSKLLFWQTQG